MLCRQRELRVLKIRIHSKPCHGVDTHLSRHTGFRQNQRHLPAVINLHKARGQCVLQHLHATVKAQIYLFRREPVEQLRAHPTQNTGSTRQQRIGIEFHHFRRRAVLTEQQHRPELPIIADAGNELAGLAAVNACWKNWRMIPCPGSADRL